MLRIVTDSTADLDQDEAVARRHGRAAHRLFGDEALLDGSTSRPTSSTPTSNIKLIPRTSQPSAGRLQEVYGDSPPTARQRSSLSTSPDALRHDERRPTAAAVPPPAADRHARQHDRRRGLQRSCGARPSREQRRHARPGALRGAGADSAPPHHILLDTLEYLQKGGRIGRAKAWLGGILNSSRSYGCRTARLRPANGSQPGPRHGARLPRLTNEVPGSERIIVQHTAPRRRGGAGRPLRAACPACRSMSAGSVRWWASTWGRTASAPSWRSSLKRLAVRWRRWWRPRVQASASERLRRILEVERERGCEDRR